MAIYFGDELRSSNKNFPILDVSDNTTKGIVFIDEYADLVEYQAGVEDDGISRNKIVQGMLLVERSEGRVFMFNGTFTHGVGGGGATTGHKTPDSTSNLTNFLSINGGASAASSEWKQVGSTPVFSSNITTNIGEAGKFGKYGNNEIVPTNGKTALEVIEDALTQYQVPAAAHIEFDDTGDIMTSQGYRITSRTTNPTNNIQFAVRNPNRTSITSTTGDLVDFGIKDIKVYRDGDSSFDNSSLIAHMGWDAALNSGAGGWKVYQGVIGSSELAGPLELSDGQNYVAGDVNFDDFASIQNLSKNASASTVGGYFTFYVFEQVSIQARGSGEFAYKVEITGNDPQDTYPTATLSAADQSGDNRGKFDVDGVVLASFSGRGNTRDSNGNVAIGESNSTTTTASRRTFGSVDAAIAITLTNNTPTTTISAITLRRSVNGGTAEDVKEYTGLTVTNGDTYDIAFDEGYSGTSGNYDANGVTGAALSSSTNIFRIEYSVAYTWDAYSSTLNTTNTSTQITTQFYLPVFYKYDATSPSDATLSTIPGSLTGGTQATNLGVSQKRINLGSSGVSDSDVISSLQNITPSDNANYLYIGIPDANFSSPAPVLNSFATTDGLLALGGIVQSGESATQALNNNDNGVGVDIGGGTNLKSVNYQVYISNANDGAFSNGATYVFG